MKKYANNMNFRVATIAAAVAAVFSSSAMAEEVDTMTLLLKPESSVRLGIGSVDAGNSRFGQFRGMQDSGVYGLADIDVVRRDDATGTWFKVRGRNLGLDSRELGVSYGPQGKWKLSLDYREIPRESQYTINTGLRGIGTENLTVQSADKRNVVLATKRERIALGATASLGGNWSTQFRFTSEEKDGARLFGRGTTGGTGNFNFLAEPIDSTITQWEGSIAYADSRFQLQGGYYGSHYSNHDTALNIAGGGTTFSPAVQNAGNLNNRISPMALSPSNEAHQFFVDGGYSFTPTTRASFKVSYTNATQNDAFVGLPVAGTNLSGRSNLGGRVDTTLAYLALTSRPMPKLSLLASLRYEDRDDKTPELQYISTSATGNHDGKNETRSLLAQQGKFEANYQLGYGYRLVAAVDHEVKERNTSAVRVVSHRDRTEESGWKLELRRMMSDTVNGSVAYIYADREGSDFEVNSRFDGAAGRNVLAPIHLADREREKIRLSADWTPNEVLSLQFYAEDARDTYKTRANLGLGARKGGSQVYSLDASYMLSDALVFSGWVTHANTTSDQATAINANEAVSLSGAQISALRIWSAALTNRTDALGFGADLKVSEKLELGGKLEFSQDLAAYRLRHERGTATNAASLPDIKYQTTTFSLFGRYAVQKNAGIRLDYIYDRRSINDWTWNAWEYSAPTAAADGTTISQDSTQRVHFVGVTAYYKWW